MIVRSHHSVRTAVIAVLFAVFAQGVSSASAWAVAGGGVGWELTGRTYPTNLAPGSQGSIMIDVFNVGAAESSGTITVTDRLPEGVTATKAGEQKFTNPGKEPETGSELWLCTGNGPGGAPRVLGATVVTCKNNAEKMPSILGGGGYPVSSLPVPQPEVMIGVRVAQEASEGSAANHVTIAGGGASSPASAEDNVVI